MKTINFKIQDNELPIYAEGYVEIHDEEAEDVDWYYWNNQGYQSRPFYHHDEEEITGLTDEQNNQIDNFINKYMDDALWIDTMILQSEENENRTYIREFCTLIINEGAKMECEIKKPANWRGDYVVEVIPKFNGKKIDLISYMQEMYESFDPWGNNEPTSCIEDNHIYFEMSKDYWEGDEQDHQDRLDDINEEARRIYARALTRELQVHSKYGESIEQSLDDNYDNEWLFKLSQFNDDRLDAFLKDEKIIGEL